MRFDDPGDEGSREPRGAQEHGEEGEHKDNVVPLPRDWIGPREELVPFGPSADRESPNTRAEAPLHPVSPEDFWGEHSAAVQDTLDRADPAATTLAGLRKRLAPRTGHLRRPVVGVGIAAALALVVAGYVTLLGPSGPSGRSPVLAKLGPTYHGALSPWSLLRPRLPASSRQSHRQSTRRSHRARRSSSAIPVRYAPQTSSRGPSVSTNSPTQTPATSPAVTPTSPAPTAPPQPQNPPRSKSPRPFGVHGLLGPGHSRSG